MITKNVHLLFVETIGILFGVEAMGVGVFVFHHPPGLHPVSVGVAAATICAAIIPFSIMISDYLKFWEKEVKT